MTLSNQTFHKLSSALKDEVVEFIISDERYAEFMLQEMIPEAIQSKLGPVDDEVLMQLSFCIFELIILQ
jgi:hypothetical protein